MKKGTQPVMRKLKENNQGLSLIEVLVAVMILAIVVTPFLHSFITAATTNAKAKSMHKATVLAQSVMEGFKAEELEDVCLQFDYPARGFRIVEPGRIGGGDVVSHVEELRYDSAAGSFAGAVNYEDASLAGEENKRDKVTASVYSEDLGENAEFLGQESGIYYFAMEDVKEDNSQYDVLVKLDATAYRADSTGTSVDVNHRYNGQELAQLAVIDLEQDALCIQKTTYTESAVNEFTDPAGESPDVIAQKMNRKITITIEQTYMGAENSKTTVITEYRYTYQADGTDPEQEYVKTVTSFDSTAAGKDLRSIYLYYYPLYSSGVSRDEIVLNNQAGVPVTFYLLKQEAGGVTSTQEEQYRMRLSVQDPGNTKDDMKTAIQTNLDTNIASGNAIVSPQYEVLLNGVVKNAGDLKWNSVLTSGVTDRVFDLEVSIYAEGAKDAGYPEDMRLTTLTGSRLN